LIFRKAINWKSGNYDIASSLLLCNIFKWCFAVGFSMHEWALAEAIIAAASEIAEKESLKEVKEVKIKVGELQQIELDILEFALLQLKPAKFQKAKFSITLVKAELKCRVCGHKWFFSKEELDNNTSEAIHFVPEVAHAYIKCPKCDSPDFEILQGRGVWLESINGAKNSSG
jgi:hydrogenase nickel incorporation protein HypA/HybF